MSKNITVTSIDGLNLADKSNMGQEQPRKKIKMLHEQLFEEYGIDPEKVFERTGILKTILPEWIPDIILLNINTCLTPNTTKNINLTDRAINLTFQTPEIREAFYQEFNVNMIKSINNFLDSKKEDPKRYNRIIVTESSVDDHQITIRY